MRYLFFVLTLLISTVVFADVGPSGPKQRCGESSTGALTGEIVINDLDLTTSRSFTLNVDNRNNWGLLSVWVNFSYNTVTRVDMTCTNSLDGGTTEYEIQSCDNSTIGVCVSEDSGVFRKTVSANKKWGPWRLNVEGIADVTCTFSVGAGSGSSSDKITVTTRLCTKGS